ncbi:Na+/H+ antiporter subunit D [Pusillimonas sp. MFBS29]|uniref:proton-conducting transporter transmembrane domain-containing protein n=1 Tax=Pusillimonas sp. MFBS29 TaxID=2886690 RepID=UPI001D128CDC|nr:proton-conducting transporter membrane subunit [Pusillimonas sp. MFBS29]MCC2595066.1 Na+/H+ antiporter subunit D [Pusillimonas sp. MFBS29]
MISSDALLTIPIAAPLAGLALATLFWRAPRLQQITSLAASSVFLWGAVLLLRVTKGGTILATQFGSWDAPFGISFVADNLTATMVLITAIMAVVVAIYQLTDPEEHGHPMFHPLYHGLLLGVTGAFMTGDIFNMYVWFEIMLISSFGLLVLGGSKEQLDAGVKYVMLNLVMTTIFLAAVAFLYGATGTLNMADLAHKVPMIENSGLTSVLALLFFLAFASKAALFPLFFWLPASYHTASTPVLAIFAALLTKVGVYAIVRCFTLIFPLTEGLATTIGVVAALTMITGVLGAASHFDIRKILSFHIISQIGYMLVGVAIATPLALAGSVLYIVHHIIVKANLFLIGGVIKRKTGSYQLKKIGGLHRAAPFLAILFCIPALSLAGLPPLSGYWAKYLVIKPSLDAGDWYLAATALLVGVLTLYSMLKIWNEAFWKAHPEPVSVIEKARPGNLFPQYIAIVALSAITLCIGLNPEPFVAFSVEAAGQLTNNKQYISAVLGGSYAYD